jgi:hypothetical protein
VNAPDEGYAQFVEARQRALQRTAWLLAGDWARAEDLVQTALARSWPLWERIRRRDDPRQREPAARPPAEDDLGGCAGAGNGAPADTPPAPGHSGITRQQASLYLPGNAIRASPV